MRIDVKKVIATKNKKLANLIPGFVIRILEKIVHQNEINAFLESHDKDNSFDFAQNTIEVAAQVSYEVINEENIPEQEDTLSFRIILLEELMELH